MHKSIEIAIGNLNSWSYSWNNVYIRYFMVNLLITMYTKCGCVDDAQQVFDKILDRDLVS